MGGPQGLDAPPVIGLLGDVMLGRGVAEALGRLEDPGEVWSQEVRELAGGCDAVVCNLECCLSERGQPTERIPGKPFFFRGPPRAVEALHAVGVAAVGLANNHALDYEADALRDTLAVLDEGKIRVAGAGDDAETARRATVFEAGELRIGLVSFSDHPREYAAGHAEPGIAWVDAAATPRRTPGWLRDQIASLRRDCDRVIAFPHWGPNMTSAPARWQRDLAAELVACGADLVAGHSAHTFHGAGWSAGGPVLYDLGDALDDYAVDPTLRNDLGLLALWRPLADEVELVGLFLDFCRTELAGGADADWIARRLERACGELGTSVERTAEQRFSLRAQ